MRQKEKVCVCEATKAPVGLLSNRTVLRQQDGGATPRQVRICSVLLDHKSNDFDCEIVGFFCFSLSEQPAVILPAIYHIVRINCIIYDLEDKHIAFFKQDKSVSIFRNVFAFEPRAALRHLLQKPCSLFKFDRKPLGCHRADLCQKCGMGHQHLSDPRRNDHAVFILLFHVRRPPELHCASWK